MTIEVMDKAAIDARNDHDMIRTDLVGQILIEGIRLTFNRAFPEDEITYDEYLRLGKLMGHPLHALCKLEQVSCEALEDCDVLNDPEQRSLYDVTYSTLSALLSLFGREEN